MGKATKKKQRAEEERIARYEAILHPKHNKEYSEQGNLKRIKALQEKTDRNGIINEFYNIFPKHIFGKYYLHKPSSWVSAKKTENFHVQLADLTSYVLCKYPVPRVLVEEVVRSPRSRYRTWFSYASRGWSLFDAKKDFPMTRKECHYFLNGDSWPNMSYAIACAKAYALGWPKDRDLRLSYISHLFRDDDFVLVHEEILDFMRFVLKWINDFSTNDYQQVWDFVKNTGTSLQGRSPRTAVDLAANWHYEQQFKRIGIDKGWEGYPIDNWVSNDAGNVWCMENRIKKLKVR